jgi:uncharacterized protein YccT (UPF0319 family)
MYPISHTAKSNYNFEIKEKHQLNLFPFYKTKFHKSEESLYISPNLFANFNSTFSHAHFILIVLHSKTSFYHLPKHVMHAPLYHT